MFGTLRSLPATFNINYFFTGNSAVGSAEIDEPKELLQVFAILFNGSSIIYVRDVEVASSDF